MSNESVKDLEILTTFIHYMALTTFHCICYLNGDLFGKNAEAFKQMNIIIILYLLFHYIWFKIDTRRFFMDDNQ